MIYSNRSKFKIMTKKKKKKTQSFVGHQFRRAKVVNKKAKYREHVNDNKREKLLNQPEFTYRSMFPTWGRNLR